MPGVPKQSIKSYCASSNPSSKPSSTSTNYKIGDSSPTNLDSIKYAALSCRRPLEQFLGKIRKHDRSLGVWGKSSVIKSTADKLRWGLGQKDDVNKLQNYLNIHIGTINILLAEHGLEKMSILSDKSSANHASNSGEIGQCSRYDPEH